jgi:hypothetical protein
VASPDSPNRWAPRAIVSPIKIILLAVRIVGDLVEPQPEHRGRGVRDDVAVLAAFLPADPVGGGPGVVLDPRRDDQVEEFASALQRGLAAGTPGHE